MLNWSLSEELSSKVWSIFNAELDHGIPENAFLNWDGGTNIDYLVHPLLPEERDPTCPYCDNWMTVEGCPTYPSEHLDLDYLGVQYTQERFISRIITIIFGWWELKKLVDNAS